MVGKEISFGRDRPSFFVDDSTLGATMIKDVAGQEEGSSLKNAHEWTIDVPGHGKHRKEWRGAFFVQDRSDEELIKRIKVTRNRMLNNFFRGN